MEVTVQQKISKPKAEVFEALVDPKKLSGYFTTQSSGRLTEGEKITWTWNDDYAADCVVDVRQVIPNKQIAFSWSASGVTTQVEIQLTSQNAQETLVTVTEGKWKLDASGVKNALEQCKGWTHMLLCLKAYLEFSINLRKGVTI